MYRAKSILCTFYYSFLYHVGNSSRR